MENIRPQNIYEALLIRPIDPNHEIAVLENGYEILHDAKGHRVLQEDYELMVIRRKTSKGGGWRARSFSAAPTCKPHRAVYL